MKKFTAVLLTVLMLFSLVSVSANAASGPAPELNPMWGGARVGVYVTEQERQVMIVSRYEEGRLNVNNSAVEGISYDLASNTLTIRDLSYADNSLFAWYMGDDFKLKVEGNCSLGAIFIYNYMYFHSASLSIIGTGKLTVNEKKNYEGAVCMWSSGRDPMKLDIADSVTVDFYSDGNNVIIVNGTTIENKDEVITQGGKPIEGVTGGRYTYEQTENLSVFQVRDLGWDCSYGDRVTKNDDPDGIYAVSSYSEPNGQKKYSVAKYLYLEDYKVHVRDWDFHDGNLTKEEVEASYTYVLEPQKVRIYYTNEWGEEHNRGTAAYQVTKEDDPDTIYCAELRWENGEETGEPDEYIVSRISWSEAEGIYVQDSAFEPISFTAEEFEASDYALVRRDVTDKIIFDSWGEVDTPPDESVNSLQHDAQVRRASDPDSIYIQSGTYESFVEGVKVAEGYMFKSVYYDEYYGAYYRDNSKEKGTVDFMIPYDEFEESEFSFIMETTNRTIPLRFITEDSTFEDYAYSGYKATKASDPDGVYAISEYHNAAGELTEYHIVGLVFNEEKGHYYEETSKFLTPEEFANSDYSFVLEPQPTQLRGTRDYSMDSLPVYTDSEGNRYVVEEYNQNKVFNFSEDNKIELFGSTYYVITPKEDVKAENLTKQVETVESEACNFMLEKKEYHHTGSGEEPEPQRIKGDVNGDGKVDVNDATLVQQYAAELIPFTDAQLRAGDTNGDGKVDINDATRIQQFAAELIPSFDA